MGVFYEEIPKSLSEWILRQKLLYVSTAPLSGSGHVNVSPKGGPYFGIIDSKTFWYMDLTGSGNETISHLLEPGNGRITIMFNAFEGPPKIVRLWGKGRIFENRTRDFDNFVAEHQVKLLPGTRSIIIVDVHQVGSSCGFSVPYFDFKDYRPILNDHFAKKQKKYREGDEKESMDRYWAYKNAWSMDGLPGMQRGMIAAKKYSVEPIKKMVGLKAPSPGSYKLGNGGFTLEQVLLIVMFAFLVGFSAASYKPELLNDVRSIVLKEGSAVVGAVRSLR